MSDTAHLMIPFAGFSGADAPAALAGLRLPHLEKLLRRLTPTQADDGPATGFSPPHERALARAGGLPTEDGRIPWAAVAANAQGRETAGEAWAFITPCHWQVGTTSATMTDPSALGLDEAGSLRLLDAMRPYFNDDGIELVYETPGRWLARGEVFRDLPTASLDRVTGQGIDAWMPKAEQARPLRRLQSEMQMLLYTHAVNDERALSGLPAVNSFWAHGTGSLPAGRVSAPIRGVTLANALRGPALGLDGPAWVQAWLAVDAAECATLLATLEQTGRARLTLCGERNAHTFEAMPTNFISRLTSPLTRAFNRKPLAAVLEAL